jgi:hypothetical protein
MSLGHTLAPVGPASRQRSLPGGLPATIGVSGERYWKLTAFLTGLGSQLFVRLIGYLAFTEAFFLVMLPLKLRAITDSVSSTSNAAILTILGMLWIIGSVIADIVNGSPFDILARGVSRSVFLTLDVICLLALWRNKPVKIEFFLIGYTLSLIASRFVFKSGAEEWLGSNTLDFTDWKSNTSYIVIGFLYLVVARYYRRSPMLIVAVTMATGLLFMAMGSRSFALTQILATALMLVFPGYAGNNAGDFRAILHKRRTILFRIIVGCLLAAVTVYTTEKAYKTATRLGYLGAKELKKLEDQENNPVGVLVSGRFGFFVGVWAGCNKPVLGHGSWPLDTYGYTQQVVDYFQIETQDARLMTKKLYWIPCHSAIVGGWVEHGIFGLLFWLFVLYLAFVNFPRAAIVFPAYAGLYAIIFSEMVWHILFSPAGHRVIAAAKIVAMLLVDDGWRRQTKNIRLQVGDAVRAKVSVIEGIA